MTPQPDNNGQLKLLLAFVLGIGVAGTGAWFFSGRGETVAARQPEPRIAVEAPASESVPPPVATPVEPVEPVRPAVSAWRPVRTPEPKRTARPSPPASPAPRQVATAPAPTPAVVEAPKPSEPQPPTLPEVVRREQPRLDAVAPPPPPPPAAASVTVKAGTVLNIRLAERISTETHKNGDAFAATLAQPLVIDGMVIAERNARIQGRVIQSERAGKVQGTAALSLELTQLTTSDGQKVQIHTSPIVKQGENSRRDDAKKVAIGSAVGAAIGAIAGGGKGAAIGAGAGAGAGAGTVVMTRGKDAELVVETRLSFSLSESVTLTEKLSN